MAALLVRDRRTETKSGRADARTRGRTILAKDGKYAEYENYGRARLRRGSDATGMTTYLVVQRQAAKVGHCDRQHTLGSASKDEIEPRHARVNASCSG